VSPQCHSDTAIGWAIVIALLIAPSRTVPSLHCMSDIVLFHSVHLDAIDLTDVHGCWLHGSLCGWFDWDVSFYKVINDVKLWQFTVILLCVSTLLSVNIVAVGLFFGLVRVRVRISYVSTVLCLILCWQHSAQCYVILEMFLQQAAYCTDTQKLSSPAKIKRSKMPTTGCRQAWKTKTVLQNHGVVVFTTSYRK